MSDPHDTQPGSSPASDPGDAYVSSLPGVLGLIDTTIARVESILLATGVLLMATNTIANVVGRFVFQSSLFFSEELNRILIILVTFAGISYAARQGRHIRMSAIYDALPARLRKPLMITMSVVTAIFMFALAWFALNYILTLQSRGRVLPALGVEQWIIYVWAPVGFLMTGLQYALTAVKNLMEKDVWLSTSVLEGYDNDEFEV